MKDTTVANWKRLRPWLHYDDTKSAFFCTTCQIAKMKSVFSGPEGYTGGSRKAFAVSQIDHHGKSSGHQEAEQRLSQASALSLGFARSARAEDDEIDQAMKAYDGAAPVTKWHTHAIRCAYFLAKRNLPYSNMTHVAHLVRSSIGLYNGETAFDTSSGCYANYTNIKTATEIVSICASDILKSTVAHINDATFFSIMVDESTDVASDKNLVILALYVYDANVQVRVLAVKALANGTAQTIESAIEDTLEMLDLNIGDVVGFASDGASVMTGVENGVAACLKMKVPRLVTSHCAAHRLSLAAQDAESAFEEVRMSAVSSANKYFLKSHPCQAKLATAIEMYETKKRRLVHASFTRCLSRGRCLASAFDLFQPIKNVLSTDLGTAKAFSMFNDYVGCNGLYYWLAFMADVLCIVNELSAQLQAKDLHVTLVPSIVAA